MEKIGDYLVKALDWSEVWAMMIPLSILLFRRLQPSSLRPVVVFVWLGFLVNIAIDVIMSINMFLPGHNLSNNPLYNIQSVLRLCCFSVYFISLQKRSFIKVKIILLVISGLYLLINFLFFENFFAYKTFSSTLFVCEAFLLLVYCMLYYLTELKAETSNLFKNPHFWVVTGLSIYVVVNFFVFLFYQPMMNMENYSIAINIWNVHNIAFIIFCLFLTKAFYVTARYQYSV